MMTAITELTTPHLPRPGVTHGNPWNFPAPEITTLDNGLQVWAHHLPGQHVIALDLTLDIDLTVEQRELEGVAMMTLHTSDEGGKDHPGASLLAALEAAGAVYDGAINHHWTGCSLDAPATRVESALELFDEIVTRPEHHPADLTRHVALRLAEIEQGRASGPATADRAMRRVVWGTEQRRGRPAGGSPETLQAITREDLVEFHRRFWRPDGARLVVAGDHPDLTGLVARHLSRWQAPSDAVVAAPEATPQRPGGSSVVHLVDRPQAVQVDLRISGAGLSRRDPALAGLQVASVAVGGSFLSRLNRRVREDLGYTYGINFSHRPSATTPRWQVATSVRTEVAAAALRETVSLMDLTSAPLTAAEVADARAQLVEIAPLRYETASSVVGQASALAIDGLTADWLNEHHAAIAATTPDEATEAFVRTVSPEQHQIVLVGPAEQLVAPLEAAGFTVVAHGQPE